MKRKDKDEVRFFLKKFYFLSQEESYLTSKDVHEVEKNYVNGMFFYYYYLNNRVFLLRDYRLRVALGKFDVFTTNYNLIC